MKKTTGSIFMVLIASLVLAIILGGCKKEENPIKFPVGAFPDSVLKLSDINSAFDDYNLDIHEINGNYALIFSSNRGSSGGQFDMVQGMMSFRFSQTTGEFNVNANTTQNSFYTKLLSKANTGGNDFGPLTLFSSVDGYEYMVLSSVNQAGNLDLYYLKNRPVFNNNSPDVIGPFPVTYLNSNSDEAYLSFNINQDTAYFTSDRSGNFDIFLHKKPAETNLDTWFGQNFSGSVLVDSVNSISDDKCPQVSKKIMVFTSNRAGGLGGYDLYYCVFRKGRWSSPVNFGPGINSSSDEYRPVTGYHQQYSNNFLMFSSNRPGGMGGFDLYFTGFDFPE
jgi:hypothetical protein